MTENSFWEKEVKNKPTEYLQAEAKSLAFVKKNMEKIMPFPCPYLDAINKELIKRYDIGGDQRKAVK